MTSKTRAKVLALGLPVLAGLIASLATLSTDRIAFVEGPLPVFLLFTGLAVGLVAFTATLLVQTRTPSSPGSDARSDAGTGSGVEERLQMLARLDGVIAGHLDAIRGHLTGFDDTGVELARSEMSRLERFLGDVQGVAALHDVPLEQDDIDPAALVTTAVRSGTRVAGDRTFKADLPTSELAPFRGDRKLLTVALVNLVVNAVKFSMPHTPVVVRVSEHDASLVFEVEDEGPGVPEGEDVWVELVRGSNAEGKPGTGLGLPLVRLVAERHGGTAELVSSPTSTIARIVVPRS